MGVITNGGHDEVRAISSDHGGLSEPGARVVFLYDGVYTHNGDEDAQGEIERDEETVECASGTREEGVEHAGERDGEGIHECCGPDENPLPEVRGVGRVFPVLKAGLGPGVGEVDE